MGLRADPRGRASFPACPPADNVATYASPCDNSTAAWLLHHQIQSLLGNLSHHLHSLQVTSAGRRPLQPDLLGWGPQFKGTFLMSPRGDIIKEFQHGPRGDLPQAAASRVTLALHGTPMREIKKEPDWKLLRRVLPLALDRVSHDGATGHLAARWNNHPMTPYISC
jgi:hypothetical protein